jgi:hypothetical protein
MTFIFKEPGENKPKIGEQALFLFFLKKIPPFRPRPLLRGSGSGNAILMGNPASGPQCTPGNRSPCPGGRFPRRVLRLGTWQPIGLLSSASSYNTFDTPTEQKQARRNDYIVILQHIRYANPIC